MTSNTGTGSGALAVKNGPDVRDTASPDSRLVRVLPHRWQTIGIGKRKALHRNVRSEGAVEKTREKGK